MARDPETGQFVEEGSMAHTYDDLEVQWLTANTAFDTAESLGIRRPFELAHGLERGELAELIGLRYAVFIWAERANTLFAGHGRWQIGTEPQPVWNNQTFGYGESSEATEEIFEEGTGGVITEADLGGFKRDIMNSEVWEVLQPHNWSTLDVGTGTGGPTLHMAHGNVNFRSLAAMGPVYDRHHEGYEVYNLENQGGAGGANEDVTMYRVVGLYWRVFDDQ